ncbi:chorismate-binding protein [Dechloromonas sp. XY25]|uniref:isochorismate synthase n=1 Tax=Dechloromonas hankyongensis TaxID=2908002 RepID=A0ABS9K4G1_9RHOO|nr:chorismate-binding protein [Dechloromonas hankyongensis]MCG2578033.1 chorismate-binding protein [Dechloromonas hankyongensis]
MITSLLRQISAPDTAKQFAALAAGAPASAPLSLRLDLSVPPSDWLHLLPTGQPWWYRARPEHGEFRLGIGHALHVESAGSNRFAALDGAFAGFRRDWRRNGPALAFSGFAFADDNASPLPNALLAIPAILLECRDGACSVTLSTPAGRLVQALAEWPSWLAHTAPREMADLRPGRPQALADRAWMARVVAALRDIGSGRLDKVVLTRCRRVERDTPFAPAAILAALDVQQPGSVVYAYGNGRQTFLGATPERLVRKAGRQIHVDALAGTAWPGSPALADDKNRHEQSLVIRAVVDALAPWCDGLPQVGQPEEHPAGVLRHWRSRISGIGHADGSLFDLVRALHPTPAVGGFPSAAARDWLAAHDERRHGWYSGGFGLLTADGDGEFSVALRSALLDGNTAELQAGAGIVAGSDPQQELAETEAKLGTLLAALNPDRQIARSSRQA